MTIVLVVSDKWEPLYFGEDEALEKELTNKLTQIVKTLPSLREFTFMWKEKKYYAHVATGEKRDMVVVYIQRKSEEIRKPPVNSLVKCIEDLLGDPIRAFESKLSNKELLNPIVKICMREFQDFSRDVSRIEFEVDPDIISRENVNNMNQYYEGWITVQYKISVPEDIGTVTLEEIKNAFHENYMEPIHADNFEAANGNLRGEICIENYSEIKIKYGIKSYPKRRVHWNVLAKLKIVKKEKDKEKKFEVEIPAVRSIGIVETREKQTNSAASSNHEDV